MGIWLGVKFKRKPALLLFLVATSFFTMCFIAGVTLMPNKTIPKSRERSTDEVRYDIADTIKHNKTAVVLARGAMPNPALVIRDHLDMENAKIKEQEEQAEESVPRQTPAHHATKKVVLDDDHLNLVLDNYDTNPILGNILELSKDRQHFMPKVMEREVIEGGSLFLQTRSESTHTSTKRNLKESLSSGIERVEDYHSGFVDAKSAANPGGDPNHSSLEILLHIGLFGNKFSLYLGFLVVYLYSVEIYPTICRTTGTSLCMASGRLGSIVCPLIYEYVAQYNPMYFFILMIVLMFIMGVLLMVLPLVETSESPLKDEKPESQMTA